MKKIIIVWPHQINIKLLLAASFLVLSFMSSRAQVVTIPDPNFAAFLQSNYPSAMSGNQLNTQDPSVLSAITMNIQSLNISDISGVEYFVNLQFLDCFGNNISTVTALPPGLHDFACEQNPLTILPPLPSTLTNLDAGFCQIGLISSFPNSLQHIIILNNQLSSLPSLPPGLLTLECQNNFISCLPLLPNTLTDLMAQGNSITCLPNVPPGNFNSDVGTTVCNSLSVTPTAANCFGDSTGYATAAFTSGSVMNYNWSTGTTGSTASGSAQLLNLPAGNYYLEVTAGSGCMSHADFVVTQPTQLVLSNTGMIPVTCSPGTIIETATGGVPPYLYTDGLSFSTNGVFPGYTNLGMYFFTVTDNNGCVANDSVVLVPLPPPTLSVPSPPVICYNDSVAVCISGFITGGISPFTYMWSNGWLGDCQYISAPGTYTVTVTDQYACFASISFTVTQNPQIIANPTIPPNICFYNPLPNQGCVNPTGGSGTYFYQWSTGDITNCINIVVPGVYTCMIIDANGCTATASQTVNQFNPILITVFSTPPSCGICNGKVDSVDVVNAFAPYFISWMGNPNTQALCDSISYTVQVMDNMGCSNAQTISFPSGCDSVWPGDANYDGVVDNTDLLPIGIGYGSTGPVRVGASLAWTGQYCDPWNSYLVSQTNYKHIDCNGDGIIDDNDTTSIQLNYGLTHPFRLAQQQGNILDPPLFFDIVVDTTGTSQQIDIPLMFGTAAIPADSIYGLAFTVNYDTTLIKADSVVISFNNSWLGVSGNDMITLAHNVPGSGQLHVGMTRINHINNSGFGELGRVSVVTTDNVSGRLLSPVYDTIRFSFSDVIVINAAEEVRAVNAVSDSLIIEDVTGLPVIGRPAPIRIYPNPAKDVLMVNGYWKMGERVEIKIADVYGRIILQQPFQTSNIKLQTSSYAAGTYFLQVITDEGIFTKKFDLVR